MRVVVVGAGEVGFHLAQRLSEEHQDVVVIESDPDQADHAAQLLDVQTVVSKPADHDLLLVLQRAQGRKHFLHVALGSSRARVFNDFPPKTRKLEDDLRRDLATEQGAIGKRV